MLYCSQMESRTCMKSELERLRRLRRLGTPLLLQLPADLGDFLNNKNQTFRRRPEQESEPNDVKVTTTCSCLMALALSRRFDQVYKPTGTDSKDPKTVVRQVFDSVFKAKWESSGLQEDNPFSTVLVMRACALLVSSDALAADVGTAVKRRYLTNDLALDGIAKYLLDASDLSRFRINTYPPKAAVLYWFVDAIHRLKFDLQDDHWRTLCNWAGTEFRTQLSLVLAHHESLMDPIALGMAACLCSRLQKIVGKLRYNAMSGCLRALPTPIELGHSLTTVFAKQDKSGIWPKYFPLFHYPNAGSNFCFTFEMLEGILAEFGDERFSLVDNPEVLLGLERAVEWCFQNRLRFTVNEVVYRGWNSGGELDSLNDGKPESWATAVVHMFLWELDRVLAKRIQKHLLNRYNASPGEQFANKWNQLIDVPITLKTREKTSIKEVLQKQIIDSASRFCADDGGAINGRISALLFGPPGTSKTQLTRAVAGALGWPIIELDPSVFLNAGIENIYSRADEVFNDLLDLTQVVVLFDEMDALVQTRGTAERLDITSQFLTTSMLPKLAKLHNHGKIVFFFATNYQSRFDQAIKRPGRFDLLLFMGPPTWDGALNALGSFLRASDRVDAAEIRAELKRLTEKVEPKELERLDALTFTEKQNFFDVLRGEAVNLLAALKAMHKDSLLKSLDDFCKFTTIREGVGDYNQWWNIERFESGLQ